MGEVEDVDRVASLFSCKVGRFSTYYLGLPLGQLINLVMCGIKWRKGLKENKFIGKTSTCTKDED